MGSDVREPWQLIVEPDEAVGSMGGQLNPAMTC